MDTSHGGTPQSYANDLIADIKVLFTDDTARKINS